MKVKVQENGGIFQPIGYNLRARYSSVGWGTEILNQMSALVGIWTPTSWLKAQYTNRWTTTHPKYSKQLHHKCSLLQLFMLYHFTYR